MSYRAKIPLAARRSRSSSSPRTTNLNRVSSDCPFIGDDANRRLSKENTLTLTSSTASGNNARKRQIPRKNEIRRQIAAVEEKAADTDRRVTEGMDAAKEIRRFLTAPIVTSGHRRSFSVPEINEPHSVGSTYNQQDQASYYGPSTPSSCYPSSPYPVASSPGGSVADLYYSRGRSGSSVSQHSAPAHRRKPTARLLLLDENGATQKTLNVCDDCLQSIGLADCGSESNLPDKIVRHVRGSKDLDEPRQGEVEEILSSHASGINRSQAQDRHEEDSRYSSGQSDNQQQGVPIFQVGDDGPRTGARTSQQVPIAKIFCHQQHQSSSQFAAVPTNQQTHPTSTHSPHPGHHDSAIGGGNFYGDESVASTCTFGRSNQYDEWRRRRQSYQTYPSEVRKPLPTESVDHHTTDELLSMLDPLCFPSAGDTINNDHHTRKSWYSLYQPNEPSSPRDQQGTSSSSEISGGIRQSYEDAARLLDDDDRDFAQFSAGASEHLSTPAKTPESPYMGPDMLEQLLMTLLPNSEGPLSPPSFLLTRASSTLMDVATPGGLILPSNTNLPK
ncbi:hypothetical protein BV898_00232 [Hypsibius exemplaris]|uniref:Uncharacterized protein n=1 Tax=Hypsibius exemplaris TaxID=2072580 RepID=A0A1W0XF65_HYPEX|nr:hypothetical protein BV898_00232 [Hypsibius exemplaris]